MELKAVLESSKDFNSIINNLKQSNIEIGMIEFVEKQDINPLPSNYTKIGNFELDIIVRDNNSNEILLIDHDKTDYVMQKVAKDITSFLLGLDEILFFYQRCDEDDSLYDNYDEMRNVALKAGGYAGDKDYNNFYLCIFGV